MTTPGTLRIASLTHWGVKPANVTVLVGTGLSRQWRPAELTEILGPRVTSLVNIRAHDAEAQHYRPVHLRGEPR